MALQQKQNKSKVGNIQNVVKTNENSNKKNNGIASKFSPLSFSMLLSTTYALIRSNRKDELTNNEALQGKKLTGHKEGSWLEIYHGGANIYL